MIPALEKLRTAVSQRYTIVREIGAGGMATVYLARDLRHDRDVALKLLKPELGAVLRKRQSCKAQAACFSILLLK